MRIPLLIAQFALVACAPVLCAPAARAQPATSSGVFEQAAQIDPAALNLLARMSWKYRGAVAYETYIDIKANGRSVPNRSTTRFRADMGQFVWSQWSPDESWRKWIFDGKTVVGYNSQFPKLYTKREFAGFRSRDFGPILDDLGLDYTLLMRVMAGEWPGQMLAHPDLHEISMTQENGQSVVTLAFHFERSFEGKDDYLRFFIEPKTLLLSRVSARQTFLNGDETSELKTEETYSRASFEPQPSPKIFDTRPPLGYQRVEGFYGPLAKR